MLKLDQGEIMYHLNTSKIFFWVLIDEIKAVLYFPVWWYTKGFFYALKRAERFVLDMEQMLGFWIWVRNIFVPMFNQRDFAGRVISFFLRLFQILVKGFILIFIIILTTGLVIIWLLLPPFVLYQAFIHIY